MKSASGTTQMGLPKKAPALIRGRNWQPGICDLCGCFSPKVARETLSGPKMPGLKRPKAPTRHLCQGCLGKNERFFNASPKYFISPTAAVQILYGCPHAYFLGMAHPKHPTSSGHAFGTAYHLAREQFLHTTHPNFGSFWHAKYHSLDALIAKLTGGKVFAHSVATQNEWELPTLWHLLKQLLLALWQQGELRSVKAVTAELQSKKGIETVWWATEMRLPPGLSLGRLSEGTDISFGDRSGWGLRGMIDIILLRRTPDGQWHVKIIDHKIPGVDIFPELGGQDSALQLQLYGCWALPAFGESEDKPAEVTLETHTVGFNPFGLTKKSIKFGREQQQETLRQLDEAIGHLGPLQHQGFPANPKPGLCQACDFGFNPSLCPDSLAETGHWCLALPYQPLA